MGCSPWGRLESDTTERLSTHALARLQPNKVSRASLVTQQ